MHDSNTFPRPQGRHAAGPPVDGYVHPSVHPSPEAAWLPPGGFVPDPHAAQEFEDLTRQWEFEKDLAQLLQTVAEEPVWSDDAREPAPVPPPPRPAGQRRRHRRRISWLRKPAPVPWVKLLSLIIAALTAIIVAMLSVLGGTIAYNPLRILAAPGTSAELATWWPLLVYGPWLVASLSIIRAALHQRRSAHSWAVVVLFSAIAVVLCIAHAPKTLPGITVAGLPPITALVSFHQLIRQITLTSPPRHALPRQRGAGPRS